MREKGAVQEGDRRVDSVGDVESEGGRWCEARRREGEGEGGRWRESLWLTICLASFVLVLAWSWLRPLTEDRRSCSGRRTRWFCSVGPASWGSSGASGALGGNLMRQLAANAI